jgi:MYXO-CTERM domain-containing protein
MAVMSSSLAVAQAPSGSADDSTAGKHATAGDTQVPRDTQKPAQLPPPGAPTWNPGFGKQVENKELSGDTPKTNSTLQKDRNGNMGDEYFGWLGLLGLAGLFGLSRGTNPAPSSLTDERTRQLGV